jgi:uncharacterized RDD family membrane protein YckC
VVNADVPDGSESGSDGTRQPAARQPPAARVLSVGAKGAERMARATGVDRAINDAVEEAIVRALRSPAVIRAIERALESQAESPGRSSDELAQVVRQVLESDGAQGVWSEFLQSQQAQQLVERVASAPEIRAAIASQGAGLITDIGVRLTVISERFDDALERVIRPRDADSETDQAGLATRAIAASVDLGLLFAGYSLISGVLASVVSGLFGRSLPLAVVIVLGVLAVLTGGAIFAAFWSLAGQTPGMRFLAIRLIHDGAHHIRFGLAVRRVFAVILSLLPLGLGYFAILRDPKRRAWADRMTGTEVIYDAVARSAPHARASPSSPAAARHRTPAG